VGLSKEGQEDSTPQTSAVDAGQPTVTITDASGAPEAPFHSPAFPHKEDPPVSHEYESAAPTKHERAKGSASPTRRTAAGSPTRTTAAVMGSSARSNAAGSPLRSEYGSKTKHETKGTRGTTTTGRGAKTSSGGSSHH
jgi:hypothetical protein